VKMLDAGISRMTVLPYGENTDNRLSRFHLIPERYGQTDGQNYYINIARQCAGDKNWLLAQTNQVAVSKSKFAHQWPPVCSSICFY